MSIELIARVLHHSRAQGTAKLVLVGIANHDRGEGGWPRKLTLAKYAGLRGTEKCRKDNVRKAVKELVEMGELEVEIQAGGTDRTPDFERTNLYNVTLSCPPWCDGSNEHRGDPPSDWGAGGPLVNGSSGMSVGRLTQTSGAYVDRRQPKARPLCDESRCAAQPVGPPLRRQERYASLRDGPPGRS
jgi:hypothetical protein